MKSLGRSLGTVLVISLGLADVSQARIITGFSAPGGLGLGGLFCVPIGNPVNTPFPNNDNSVVASPNQISNLPSTCGPEKPFQVLAPIDSLLFVESSGGTTEYYFTETVKNNTGSIWKDFHFELGFISIDGFTSFNEIVTIPEVLLPDFDIPDRDPVPTSSEFANLVQEDFSLWWSGGSVAPGESVDFTFSIDIPDDIPPLDSYDNFALRQTPSVPEPSSTLALLAFGIAGAGSAVFRKLKE